MKRLTVAAVVLVTLSVMVGNASAHTRPRVMPASHACPACSIGNESADPVTITSGKATPILF